MSTIRDVNFISKKSQLGLVQFDPAGAERIFSEVEDVDADTQLYLKILEAELRGVDYDEEAAAKKGKDGAAGKKKKKKVRIGAGSKKGATAKLTRLNSSQQLAEAPGKRRSLNASQQAVDSTSTNPSSTAGVSKRIKSGPIKPSSSSSSGADAGADGQRPAIPGLFSGDPGVDRPATPSASALLSMSDANASAPSEPTLSFSLETPAELPPAPASLLTRAIPLGSAPEMTHSFTAEELAELAGWPTRGGRDVCVHFGTFHKILVGKRLEPMGPEVLKLRVPAHVPLARFIEFALGRYNEEASATIDARGVLAESQRKKYLATPEVPDAWFAKLAEDDGEPDEDMPEDLDQEKTIEKFGILSHMVLIPNPMYKPGARISLHGRSMSSGGLNVEDWRRSSCSLRTMRMMTARQQQSSEKVTSGMVRVTLQTLAAGQYVVVPYSSDMLVESLLDYICRKRGLGASFAYELRDGKDHVVASGDGEVVGDLPDEVLQDLRLCAKSVSAPAADLHHHHHHPGASLVKSPSRRVLYTEATASQLTEHVVGELSKRGNKFKERVMEIDGSMILVRKPGSKKSKGSGVFSSRRRAGKPKDNKERRISEVRLVALQRDADSNNVFAITYANNERKVYRCDSHEEAAEIVAKITFLVSITPIPADPP